LRQKPDWLISFPLCRLTNQRIISELNTVLYVLKNSCLWRDLSGCFLLWDTVC